MGAGMMRLALADLSPTSAPYKVGATWVVNVQHRDGRRFGNDACVTFRTKRDALAFAAPFTEAAS